MFGKKKKAADPNELTQEEEDLLAGKKKYPRARFIDFLAFLALTASAVLLTIGPICKQILPDTGLRLMQTFSAIAEGCLLAAIAIPGWCFVRRKRLGWKLFYLACLLIYIAGCVLGLVFVI